MEYRKVEQLHSGSWIVIPFENLKSGDTFRLFDETNGASGETDTIEDGTTDYIATSDAFSCEPQGNFGIEAHPKVQHAGIFHQETARIAYRFWEFRGGGRSTQEQADIDWFKAETFLKHRFEQRAFTSEE